MSSGAGPKWPLSVPCLNNPFPANISPVFLMAETASTCPWEWGLTLVPFPLPLLEQSLKRTGEDQVEEVSVVTPS